MEAHPNVALTVSPPVLVRSDTLKDTPLEDWRTRRVSPNRLLLSNPFSASSAMFWRELPYRFEPPGGSADYQLWLQIVLDGYAACCLKVPHNYSYNLPFGERGMTANLWEMQKSELRVYWQLARSKRVSFVALFWLIPFSLSKWLRRVGMVAARRVYSER